MGHSEGQTIVTEVCLCLCGFVVMDVIDCDVGVCVILLTPTQWSSHCRRAVLFNQKLASAFSILALVLFCVYKLFLSLFKCSRSLEQQPCPEVIYNPSQMVFVVFDGKIFLAEVYFSGTI